MVCDAPVGPAVITWLLRSSPHKDPCLPAKAALMLFQWVLLLHGSAGQLDLGLIRTVQSRCCSEHMQLIDWPLGSIIFRLLVFLEISSRRI